MNKKVVTETEAWEIFKGYYMNTDIDILIAIILNYMEFEYKQKAIRENKNYLEILSYELACDIDCDVKIVPDNEVTNVLYNKK